MSTSFFSARYLTAHQRRLSCAERVACPRPDTLPSTDTLRPSTDTLRPSTDTLRPSTSTLRPSTHTESAIMEQALRPSHDIPSPSTDTPPPSTDSMEQVKATKRPKCLYHQSELVSLPLYHFDRTLTHNTGRLLHSLALKNQMLDCFMEGSWTLARPAFSPPALPPSRLQMKTASGLMPESSERALWASIANVSSKLHDKHGNDAAQPRAFIPTACPPLRIC
ncbi:uncharacterized protein BDZ99DRAFT_267983 [Mytilinidion resinicola]|uniref:Uncharacterized protein n=1 Tax=Mytilinidion resinicola TaxID=574789 RepID=A0A6A6YVC0_9PEZI|nr:uncharacterized protein BDZ99DRAFT_267983 [Mytilinidion resinicola]KAF2812498.1 hypothetical protein BDZ99DRAFT_267983 [Mytilinidion resinicola]